MSILQWLHGFRLLGHHVICVDYVSDATSATIKGFTDLARHWWYLDCAILIDRNSLQSVAGLPTSEFLHIVQQADALIDIGAPMTREPLPLLESIRPRILIDRDPVVTQLWVDETTGDVRDIYGEQDYYFTFGTKLGSSDCAAPTHGIDWIPMWNPVVLDWWNLASNEWGRFTTVASWWEGGYHEFDGQLVGPKAEEWRRFMDLPGRVGETLEIALSIEEDDDDVAVLRENGWHLVVPEEAVGTPSAYRHYIQGSAGEFSCAKGIYASTKSGWFSDRSICYLAAGRPVVVQATGFEDILPTGKGLFSVKTVEEATDAIQAIRSDYGLHSHAARDIAVEYFDANRCLSHILDRAGLMGALPSRQF